MRLMRRSVALPLFLAVAAPLAAQQVLSKGALIVKLGSDTMAVEQFSRTAQKLEGRLLRRTPVTSVIEYSVAIGPNALPTRFEYHPVTNGAPRAKGQLQWARISFDKDSATIEVMRDTLVTRRIAAVEGIPGYPESYALYELIYARLRASGRDSMTAQLVALAGPSGRFPVALAGRDSARGWVFGAPLRIRIDGNNRILGLDGSATTIKYTLLRSDTVDLDALAKHFAAIDAEGHALGTWVSSRDTVRARVGAANLWIDYGRPSKRGRVVFDHGVLGDTLWRTGANAATQLRTDVPLELGGQTLPAGMYTLWTHAGASGYELVINSQVGQWGTQHDWSKDLFRVPLHRVALAAPIEQFTIDVQQKGDGGVLKLAWDTVELSAPFKVKP